MVIAPFVPVYSKRSTSVLLITVAHPAMVWQASLKTPSGTGAMEASLTRIKQ